MIVVDVSNIVNFLVEWCIGSCMRDDNSRPIDGVHVADVVETREQDGASAYAHQTTEIDVGERGREKQNETERGAEKTRAVNDRQARQELT